MTELEKEWGFPGSLAGKEFPAKEELRFNSWFRKICWRRDKLPIPVFLGLPGDSAGKEPACNVGDLGLISGLGRSPGEGKVYPRQYSELDRAEQLSLSHFQCQTEGRRLHFPWEQLTPLEWTLD